MNDFQHERELLTLKAIAETLNQSSDLKSMLQSVLEELLSVTGLKTGWIFLTDNKPDYVCTADVNLPQALSLNNKQPMCSGSCWCLNKYWDGKLKQAVNIIECKRLEDALKYNTGDTEGLSHHATVPLSAGGETFGLLNVGSPGKEKFSQEELTLLESVAYQIGTAIKRTTLYQSEQKRAENFTILEALTRELWKLDQTNDIVNGLVKHTGEAFNWPVVGFLFNDGEQVTLRALYQEGSLRSLNERYTWEDLKGIHESLQVKSKDELRQYHSPFLRKSVSTIARSVSIRNEQIGVLFAESSDKKAFDRSEGDVLKAIADHMALAIENARINVRRQELILSEERNRLARDLHDSVSQKLFSLSMTAKGAQSLQENNLVLTEALVDIQELAQEAMKEMRTLIWQLRPAGIEAGLMTSLKAYAISLGLEPVCEVTGLKVLPAPIEEALYRIGQESLNNVLKHARVKEVFIHIDINNITASLTIQDTGVGFDKVTTGDFTLGLRGMKERVNIIGGTLRITSEKNKGATVQAVLPLSE
ncbi:GAF domain-containing protein [Pseudalkalibacillus hwajinpoensis]|uniref:GAF domain-containing sensor histidine kinase n=1 Tax=Guptibacillus hwajinpoensis TaxID=208199 RepID=UPI00325C1103